MGGGGLMVLMRLDFKLEGVYGSRCGEGPSFTE